MNILVIMFAIIAFLLLAGLLILNRNFRKWIESTFCSIGLLLVNIAPGLFGAISRLFKIIFGVLKIYSLILLISALSALILIAIALLTNSQILIVIAIMLLIVAWIPIGLILRLMKLTDGVVPVFLKTFVAWTAFVGFLGLMCPDVLTFKSFIGASLIGLILFGASIKSNALKKLVFPLIFLMCVWTAWSHFWPESFRSTTRYVESLAKLTQTKKDRGSIRNETDAATTYGVALKDIYSLYKCNNDSIMNDANISVLKTGTLVKLVNHKKEVKVLDGQGFIEIQLVNSKGSFVKGEKYWVEAEYLQITSPGEIISQN